MNKRTFGLVACIAASVVLVVIALRWTASTSESGTAPGSEPSALLKPGEETSSAGNPSAPSASSERDDIAHQERQLQALIASQREQVERQKLYQEREIAKQARMRSYLDTVKNETIADSVANLLLEPLSNDFQVYSMGAVGDPLDSKQMEHHFRKDPRVAKVWNVIEQGSDDERRDLHSILLSWMDYVLTDLPLEPVYGVVDVHIRHLRGGMMYPIMLAELDPSPQTLDLIYQLYQREQDASRQSRINRGRTPSDEPTYTQVAGVAALAAERVFNEWDQWESQGTPLSVEEQQLLDRYRQLDLPPIFGPFGPNLHGALAIMESINPSED